MNETDVLRELRELVAELRRGEENSPYGYDDNGNRIPMFDGNDCAAKLEKLLPGLEKSLKERAACGHLKLDTVYEYECPACHDVHTFTEPERDFCDKHLPDMLPERIVCTACRQQEQAVHAAKAEALERVAKWLENGHGSEEIVELLQSNAIVMRAWAAAERKLAQ